MANDDHRSRRSRARLRRDRWERANAETPSGYRSSPRETDRPASPAGPAIGAGVGWDRDAELVPPEIVEREAPLPAQLLALFAEPGVYSLTASAASATLSRPEAEVENALDALAQAGEVIRSDAGIPRYSVNEARKTQLVHMFTEAAHELGETRALVRVEPAAMTVYDDDDEPRLPVTAGLLSLFLPGTGQLLNGDVGRASLVFAVWSLALLTHLSPIWTFVALYAGAEAFFTAKVRGIERRLELEAAARPEPSEG